MRIRFGQIPWVPPVGKDTLLAMAIYSHGAFGKVQANSSIVLYISSKRRANNHEYPMLLHPCRLADSKGLCAIGGGASPISSALYS